jgi:hypothetical protein
MICVTNSSASGFACCCLACFPHLDTTNNNNKVVKINFEYIKISLFLLVLGCLITFFEKKKSVVLDSHPITHSHPILHIIKHLYEQEARVLHTNHFPPTLRAADHSTKGSKQHQSILIYNIFSFL